MVKYFNGIKRDRIVLLLLLLGMVCSFCSMISGKAAEKKEFIVGFDAEFPPYGYLDDDGEYVGKPGVGKFVKREAR